MPDERPRSLFGPVLLIVVGVGLLLSQLGLWSLSWSRVWAWWPLAIVLLGADLLLGRTRVGRWVFLALAVAAAGVVLVVPPPNLAARLRDQQMVAYPLENWREAEVQIHMGVGRLVVGALEDSDQMIHAEITHDRRRSRVSASLERRGDKALVVLKNVGASLGPAVGEGDLWDVRLSPDLPLALEIEGGVSRSEMNLTGLHLTRLDLNVGVGEVLVTLAEQAPYAAYIHGGVGRLVVQVPADAPVRIRVDGGLGAVTVDPSLRRDGNSYVTANYRAGQPAIEVRLDGGIGAIVIR
ncbi:MAG: DUF5668 domain-containing protein [Chloroflexota bacterium]